VDLQRVAVFAKVVEEGGFTAAARALGLPKSSVSRAVALLEEEIGARLLRRSTRSVALTEAGAAFYERASRGLAAIAEAREAVVDLEAEIRGPIRITAAVDSGAWILAPIVAAFVEQHPAVRIDVVLTSRLVDVVEEGFDLALRAGEVVDQRLIAKKLPRLDFGIYGSEAYLAAHGTPACVADLAAHRCVLFRATRGRATWSLSGPRGKESVEVEGAISVDDFSFALRAVASGAGLALVPSFLAERAAGDTVRRVLREHVAPGAPLHLVYASGRYLPRRVAALRDFVLAEAQRAPPDAPPSAAPPAAAPKRRR
jgi:DNA-binding transcriptional LysR family regulator